MRIGGMVHVRCSPGLAGAFRYLGNAKTAGVGRKDAVPGRIRVERGKQLALDVQILDNSFNYQIGFFDGFLRIGSCGDGRDYSFDKCLLLL